MFKKVPLSSAAAKEISVNATAVTLHKTSEGKLEE